MKHFWITAVLGAVLVAGCGDEEVEQPEAPDAGTTGTGNAFLAGIDADSSYVYANLERLPESMVDRMWAVNDATAASNQAIFDALAEDDELPAAARALAGEIAQLTTREGWEAAGLPSNPFYAVYGVSLMPFFELELADDDAFAALIGRIETALGQPLPRRDIDGTEIIWIEIEPGFGVALRHGNGSMTGALIPDDAAMLARVAGQYQPADPMRASTLAEFNRESGFTPHGSGFVDWRRVVDEFLAEDPVLARLAPDEELQALRSDPACMAEFQAVTEALPRMVMGYTRLDGNRADVVVRQETSPELAAGLAPIARAPVSIDRELTGLFNLGLAFDLVAAREFARGLVDGWVENPPQCPAFAEVASNAPRAQEGLNRPIPPMVTNLHGAYLQASDLKLDENGMPTGGGTLTLFMRQPQLLVGMAQRFSPAVAELELEPGGEPRKVPPDVLPQLAATGLEAWLAMGDSALGIAIGAEHVDALKAEIESTSPDDLIVTGKIDFAILTRLMDMAQGVLDEEESPELLEMQRAQYEAFAEVYDRAGMKMRLGDRGIELIVETTMK